MRNLDACPICYNGHRNKLGEKDFFEIFRCQKCKSIYTKKIEYSTEDFDYSTYYESDNLDIPEFVFQSLKAVVKNFEPFRQNNRFLDVGCGAGTLLDVARSLNWDAEGIEVSDAAVEHLKKRGLKIFDFFDSPF